MKQNSKSLETDGLSVIVPAYNSVQSLPELVSRCTATFEQHSIFPYEIIFVDDASPDPDVWPMVEKLVEEHPQVRGARFSRNFGQQAATLCGLGLARGQYALTMDDDLQHRPEDIAALWEARSQADIVIGEYGKKNHAYWRNVCSRIKGYLDYKLIGKPKGISLSPFRLMSRLVVDGVLDQKPVYPFIPAMMFCVSQNVVGVSIEHQPRKYGASTYSLRKMFGVFSNLLINNSSYLLQLIGRCGVFVACLAFFSGAWFFFRKIFFGISATGWTSLFLLTSFLGGLNLLAVSVIGEYLIRIIRTVESKPRFCVRNLIGGDR